MTTLSPESQLLQVTRVYRGVLLLGFALVPMLAITYLHLFSQPSQRFLSYGCHEAAIATAIAISAFVSLVTWRCYRFSGEPLLRWVAQGLTGFTLVYLPHGLLTRMAECNIWLFLLYGPVSRTIMACCLFIGLLQFQKEADSCERRLSTKPFWGGIAVFALIDLLVAWVSYTPIAGSLWLRLSMESVSALLALIGIGIVIWRRITSPLIQVYALSLALFAQSSLSFCLAKPWGHQWWLGHVIFAAGFFTLSYGISKAFLTTRSFISVYSQEEMMKQLEHANNELERLAAEDPLTGASNRRHFFRRAVEELDRAKRHGEPVSLLMLDLDHFKAVNDSHGHAAGDTVLVSFVQTIRHMLRSSDLVGRLGGEEFVVLLPGSSVEQAVQIANRICEAMDRNPIKLSDLEKTVHVTVSIGVAEFGADAQSIENLTGVADDRLYIAKASGRNCVVFV
jgi:two-component system cell cycle response regulator